MNTVLDFGGIKITWEQGCLRAYKDGVFVGQTATNPSVSERGIFIQRWV